VRCVVATPHGRCLEEEGHDTGVGTPHRFAAPNPVAAAHAAMQAARELTTRLGIPCTVVGVGGVAGVRLEVSQDEGDVTCAQADDSPEGVARQVGALLGASDERMRLQAMAQAEGHLIGTSHRRRERVLAAVLAFLEASDSDWQRLWGIGDMAAQAAFEEAKQLHDAQLAELLSRIGEAL
jgi:hypothetical protein